MEGKTMVGGEMKMRGLVIALLLVCISAVVSAHPQPVVDITSADITQDRIHVDLSPSGLTGTLKLELVTPDYHLIREVSRSSGSYNENFDIPNLSEGEYNYVVAKWIFSWGYVFDYYSYHIKVLGNYRHTFYNTPDESGCSGSNSWFSYTVGTCQVTDCIWHDAQGRSGWLNEIEENGSGRGISGHIYVLEHYCTGNRYSPGLRRTDQTCPACGGTLSTSDVAINENHDDLSCGDQVFVYQLGGSPGGVYTVRDYGGGLSMRQLDHYYGTSDCNDVPGSQYRMTVKLY